MPVKVVINGLGPVGRATMRAVLADEGTFELVAVNDIATDEASDAVRDDEGRRPDRLDRLDQVAWFAITDPAELPWGRLGVDLVFECTGNVTTGEEVRRHLDAGARRVVRRQSSARAIEGDRCRLGDEGEVRQVVRHAARMLTGPSMTSV